MNKIILKITVEKGFSGKVSELLSAKSGLSRVKVKDAMNKGAVRLRGKKGKMRRLRRAKSVLRAGDYIELYYDEKLLSIKPPVAECLHDPGFYSVWHKPAGLMSQGTTFGDHCSLLRQAELFFTPRRKAYLVHRLDREASGLMLVAHSSEAAAGLSELFNRNQIEKEYRIEVLGCPDKEGTIELPLDNKPAATSYEVISFDKMNNTTTVKVFIQTGRLHQIRRHFNMIGHPVMGDPAYGEGNKNSEGMKLAAVALRIHCPFTNKDVEFNL